MKKLARYILPTLFVVYIAATMGGEIIAFFMMIGVIVIIVKACNSNV